MSAFITGTSETSYPKHLFAFTTWIDQFGDHFAGDRCAYHAIQNEMDSIKHIHSVLQDEQRALSKAYTALVKVAPCIHAKQLDGPVWSYSRLLAVNTSVCIA